jgi:DNA-binding MarR family transcriptional regulator
MLHDMLAAMQADVVVALDRAFELAGRLADLMEGALAARGLTVAQAHVLFVLHERGPLVQRELGEALGRTPRHVTTLVDALEATGLVARGPHPTDRRATLVSLTAPGRSAAARMHAERQEAARALFGGAPAAEVASFVSTADRVLSRLDELVAGPAPTGRHPQQEKKPSRPLAKWQ